MRVFAFVLVSVLLSACGNAPPTSEAETKLLVIGASGRIGSVIAQEALDRGYSVDGMTREASRLDGQFEGLNIVVGDILDREYMTDVVANYDAILVSVGGPPSDPDPAQYIAATAAQALIDVMEPLGAEGPRMIFVGNLFTLLDENGVMLIDNGRVDETHRNYAMFVGHKIALQAFLETEVMPWTVASPPNGLRLEGRTGIVRWGEDSLIMGDDGKPAAISREDFAYAVLEELEQARYVRDRFTVAR